MTGMNPAVIWAVSLVVVTVLLWLLGDVLMPFLIGAAIAYFLDPSVQFLERKRVGRGLATLAVIGLFFVIVIGALIVLAPVLERQLVGLVQRLFQAAQELVQWARPFIDQSLERVGVPKVSEMGGAGDLAGKIAAWFGTFISGLWSGGLAVFNLLSLVVVTPVVAFYLLRDWPKIVSTIDSWLPRANAQTIRDLLHLIDERLAGFVRGQALVCLVLGLFYAVALTLVGLNYGLIGGLLAGLLSVIPFIGAAIGAVITLTIAFFQYDTWLQVGIVAVIFALGQFLEGNILSPRLVGDRVGLHPVWLMFALMAGGALFGFLGMLLAVPVAAAVGVLTRFSLERYKQSDFYRGPGAGSGTGRSP